MHHAVRMEVHVEVHHAAFHKLDSLRERVHCTGLILFDKHALYTKKTTLKIKKTKLPSTLSTARLTNIVFKIPLAISTAKRILTEHNHFRWIFKILALTDSYSTRVARDFVLDKGIIATIIRFL